LILTLFLSLSFAQEPIETQSEAIDEPSEAIEEPNPEFFQLENGLCKVVCF